MYGKKRTEESREKQSKTRTERILTGEYSSWFKKGEFTSEKGGVVSFKSSWEELATRFFDEDPAVTSFKYEPFAIQYYHSAKGDRLRSRHYIPDFLVEYVDGRKVVVEIKPECFIDAAINVAKFSAARRYCVENGMKFEVWTQDRFKEVV